MFVVVERERSNGFVEFGEAAVLAAEQEARTVGVNGGGRFGVSRWGFGIVFVGRVDVGDYGERDWDKGEVYEGLWMAEEGREG